MEDTALEIKDITKVYKGGFKALNGVSLSMHSGEIFALLGPNGAGKTTLIDAVCGIVNITSGTVSVGGYDVVKEYRKARSLIGLVPQEISLDIFISVDRTLDVARGFFGRRVDAAYKEKVLKMLSLWDKRNNKVQQLSGGMKRRVLIAKALMNEPKILFLDEPTAGVDVDLRRDLWNSVRKLKEGGTTVILTTHYLEEAEELADRVAVIRQGEIILVEEKDKLMKHLGGKKLILELSESIDEIPDALKKYNLELSDDKMTITYAYEKTGKPSITSLLNDLREENIVFSDMRTEEQTLEKIFVDIVNGYKKI